MLNAILRRIAAAGPPAGPDPGPVNTPAWLLASWTAAYGASAANAIARAHLAEPPLDLMVRGDAAAFAAEVGGVALLDQLVRRPVGGAVEELPGYADGAFWVQDLAATLPARLLAPPPGAPVLDLCAAPGGKTLQLAAMGARVTAVDSSAERLRIVLANLERTRLAAELIVADVRSFAPAAPFPYVLLDAPCTATGTIRRHPDIQHLKQPGDVARLAALQAELMAAAARLVAPGGRLVYAVCSLQPEEGPAVIDAFLAATAGLAPEPIDRAELGGLAVAIDAAGRVRTLPCDLAEHGGMDGFFIARLRRRG
jgi:16S rRNA (cytosine967-C5)-methyltransferase